MVFCCTYCTYCTHTHTYIYIYVKKTHWTHRMIVRFTTSPGHGFQQKGPKARPGDQGPMDWSSYGGWASENLHQLKTVVNIPWFQGLQPSQVVRRIPLAHPRWCHHKFFALKWPFGGYTPLTNHPWTFLPIFQGRKAMLIQPPTAGQRCHRSRSCSHPGPAMRAETNMWVIDGHPWSNHPESCALKKAISNPQSLAKLWGRVIPWPGVWHGSNIHKVVPRFHLYGGSIPWSTSIYLPESRWCKRWKPT